MKIPPEYIHEYINLVKKNENKEISFHTAHEEFHRLLLLIAHLYLPSEVMRIFEINIQREYTIDAIHNIKNDGRMSLEQGYKKG